MVSPRLCTPAHICPSETVTNVYHTDILIEDAKNHLQTWGSQPPTFLLCNGALTAQLTMLPEKTNYVTNGVDGQKRLAQGPELASYRGLSIIHSRKFSMDTGTTPRDLLRRRVRVAEYYRIPWTPMNSSRTYEFYDQSRDTMFRLTWDQLCQMAHLPGGGVGSADEDFPGHAGQFWQIMPGAEEPEEFQWNDWDGTQNPAAVRLVLTNVPGAPGAAGQSYEITGIESLLQAMGLSAGSRHRPSSLIWPRTIFPTSGDKRKKRTIDQISHDFESQNAVSSKYAVKHMNNLQKYHHCQSETFGAGIYNDPISHVSHFTLTDLNWDALHRHHQPAELLMGMVTRAFFELHQSLRIEILENELQNGLVRPTQFELNNAPNGMGFEQEAFVRVLFARNQENTLDGHYGAGAVVAAPQRFPPPVAAAHQIDGLNLQNNIANDEPILAREVAAKFDNAQGLNLTTDYVRHAASAAMFWYLQVLFQWRKLCYGDAIEHMVRSGATEITAHNNCGGHNKFATMKKGLYTACLMQTNPGTASVVNDATGTARGSLHDPVFVNDAINDPRGNFASEIEKVQNDYLQQNEMAKISMNVINATFGSNNVPRQPNLHINRCDPLTSEHEKAEATSINKTSWLLQHIAAMMPLTPDMAESLMKSVGTAPGDARNVLKAQYNKFLTGNANANVILTDDDDTFLMHWFMSEFHPTLWVREIAKKKCGMNNNEMPRVQRCLDALADALIKNTTYTDELKEAFTDIVPGKFDGNRSLVLYSTATTAKSYDCVRKWNKDKNLHVTTCKWMDTPVNVKKEVRMQSDVQTNSIFPAVNAMPEGRDKAVSKACAMYHRANLSAALQLHYENSSIPQEGQKYFDVNSQSIHPVHRGDHLINLSHPWTNYIPDGIESLSSTHFPIDWQYRPEQTNPEFAGQEVYADNSLRHAAQEAAQSCRSSPHEAMREVLMILFTRFFKPAARFMNNGAGVALAPKSWNNNKWNYSGYAFAGCHLKHGPYLLETSNSSGKGVGGAQDIVILRPNIEHEMLGIIMGRGGTQELGATFWGQTELSCYDDAQHGKYQ